MTFLATTSHISDFQAREVINNIKQHFSDDPNNFQIFIRFLELYRQNRLTDSDLIQTLLKLFYNSPEALQMILPFLPQQIGNHILNSIDVARKTSVTIKIATQNLLEQVKASFGNNEEKFGIFIILLQKLKQLPTADVFKDIRDLINNPSIYKELEIYYLAPYKQQLEEQNFKKKYYTQRKPYGKFEDPYFDDHYRSFKTELMRRIHDYTPPEGSRLLTRFSIDNTFFRSFTDDIPIKQITLPESHKRKGPKKKKYNGYWQGAQNNYSGDSTTDSYEEPDTYNLGFGLGSKTGLKRKKKKKTSIKDFEYSSSNPSENEEYKSKPRISLRDKDTPPSVTMDSMGVVDIPEHFHVMLVSCIEIYEKEQDITSKSFSKLLLLYNLKVINRLELMILLKSLFDYIDNSFSERLFTRINYCDIKLNGRLYPIKCTMYEFLKEKLYRMDSYDYVSPSYMQICDSYLEQHKVESKHELEIFNNRFNYVSRSKGRERKQGSINEEYYIYEEKITTLDVQINRLKALSRKLSNVLITKHHNPETEVLLKISKIDEAEIKVIYKEKHRKILRILKENQSFLFGIIIKRLKTQIVKYGNCKKSITRRYGEALKGKESESEKDKEKGRKELFGGGLKC